MRRSVAALTLVVVAAGCSGPETPISGEGPLKIGGDSGALCTPVGDHREATIAFDLLSTRSERVTIEGIALLEPVGMRLVSSELMPVRHDMALGVWPQYPPVDGLGDGVSWDERTDAVGATLRPDDPVMNLVLRAELTGPSARVEAVEITYVAQDRSYRERTTTSIELVRGPRCDSAH